MAMAPSIPAQIPMAQPVDGGANNMSMMPGIVYIKYQSKGCLEGNRTSIKIFVDNAEVGKLEQGGESSYHVPPGPHRVVVKEGGISGAITSMFGSSEFGQQAVVVMPGQTHSFSFAWKSRDCLSSRFDPSFSPM